MKTLLVTLIHNRKRFLAPAIQSAVNQTLPKEQFIHLLVDNGSTEPGIPDLINAFQKRYSNIIYLPLPTNIGQQPAYNLVLNEWLPKNFPEAELWATLDSDDLLKPDALLEANKLFELYPKVGQVYSGFDIINSDGNIKVKNHPKAKLIPNQFSEAGQLTLRRTFLSQNCVGHLRAFRVSALKDIGGFNTDYKYATDFNIAGRMLEKFWVAKIDKVLYQWRQHDEQVERQHSPEQTDNWKKLKEEFSKKWVASGLI